MRITNSHSLKEKQRTYLDGYIAEQHHAQTFNLNAAAGGSKFRARVV